MGPACVPCCRSTARGRSRDMARQRARRSTRRPTGTCARPVIRPRRSAPRRPAAASRCWPRDERPARQGGHHDRRRPARRRRAARARRAPEEARRRRRLGQGRRHRAAGRPPQRRDGRAARRRLRVVAAGAFSGLAERPRVVHADDIRAGTCSGSRCRRKLDSVLAAERLHRHQIRRVAVRRVGGRVDGPEARG